MTKRLKMITPLEGCTSLCGSSIGRCFDPDLYNTSQIQGLPPLSHAFEVTTGVVIPCGSRCVVQNYRAVLEAGMKCVFSDTGIIMKVYQFIEDNDLDNIDPDPTYQQIYDAVFGEGNSPICGWYKTAGECFKEEFGRICGEGIKDALMNIMQDYETNICSLNPSYLACLAHPSLIGNVDMAGEEPPSGPYFSCILGELGSYFQNITSENYYNEIILKDNGNGLFTELSKLAVCIGNATKSVPVTPPTGCSVVGDNIRTYMIDAFKYFDFGQGGKDYLKCFANDELHQSLMPCGTEFLTDLDTALPGGAVDVLRELNTTLYNGRPGDISWVYNKLSNCLKVVFAHVCSANPDSLAIVNRTLLPLDLFFDGNDGNDDIQFCSTPAPTPAPTPVPAPTKASGAKMVVSSQKLIGSGLLMLLFIILILH